MFIADTLSKSPKLSSAKIKLLVRKSDLFQLLVEIKIQSTHAQIKKRNNFGIHHYFRMYLINLT